MEFSENQVAAVQPKGPAILRTFGMWCEIALRILPVVDAGYARLETLLVLIAEHEFAHSYQMVGRPCPAGQSGNQRLRNSVPEAERFKMIPTRGIRVLPIDKLETVSNRIEAAGVGVGAHPLRAIAIEQDQ